MDSPAAPPIQSFLSQRVREGASAGQVADMVDSAWRQIVAALAPVIGQRGVAALYKRSLHLATAPHPWLAAAQDVGSLAEMNLAALRAELVRRSGTEAAAAGAALLLSFHGLVGSLIGPALSGQLLGGVWVKFFSGSPAQDPPP
ncbi:MAG: hypothetical protein JWQ76_678 [Ramlibacter sp.]|nr:hypothetical protein [Ramlibacter sp.]